MPIEGREDASERGYVLSEPKWSMRFAAVLLGCGIALPIFFTVSQTGIHLAPQYSEIAANAVTAIPLGAIALFILSPVFLAGSLWRAAKTPTALDVLVLAYIFVNTVSCIYGLATLSNMHWVAILYAKTMYPVLAYFAMRWLMRTPWKPDSVRMQSSVTARDFWNVWVAVIILFLAGYLIQTLLTGPSYKLSAIAGHIGPFYDYKVKRFFPIAMAVAGQAMFAKALCAQTRSHTLKFLAVWLGIGVSLSFEHSRLAVLIFGLSAVMSTIFLVVFFRGRLFRRAWTIGLTVCALAVLTTFCAAQFYQIVSVKRIESTVQAVAGMKSLDHGDDVRFSRMARGLRATFQGPFGMAFQPENRNGLKRVLVAESAFLDAGVSAGPLAMTILLLISVMAVIKSFQIPLASCVESPCVWLQVLLLGVIPGLVLFGAIWINSQSDPYIGPVYWALIGTLPGLEARTRVSTCAGA